MVSKEFLSQGPVFGCTGSSLRGLAGPEKINANRLNFVLPGAKTKAASQPGRDAAFTLIRIRMRFTGPAR